MVLVGGTEALFRHAQALERPQKLRQRTSNGAPSPHKKQKEVPKTMTAKAALSLSSPKADDSDHSRVVEGDTSTKQNASSASKMQKLISKFSKEKSFSFLSIRDENESLPGLADGSSTSSSSWSLNGSVRTNIGNSTISAPLHPRSRSLASPPTRTVTYKKNGNKTKNHVATVSPLSTPVTPSQPSKLSRRLKNPKYLNASTNGTVKTKDTGNDEEKLDPKNPKPERSLKTMSTHSENDSGGGDDASNSDEISITDLETYLEENRNKVRDRERVVGGVDESLHSSKAGSSVQFSDMIDMLELDQQSFSDGDQDELFYTDEDIDRFRYEAFMESCGLDPNDTEFLDPV